MRIFKLFLLLFAAILVNSACATDSQSIATGAGVGSVAGATAGLIASNGNDKDDRIKKVVIGAAAGGVLGAIAGHLTHDSVEEQGATAYQNGKLDGQEFAAEQAAKSVGPTLTPPKTEAFFVDDQIRGNVFIPAHFEYRIVEPAKWSK